MEKPIIFNSAMVRAILSGRKTQTRRIIKDNEGFYDINGKVENANAVKSILIGNIRVYFPPQSCPFGVVGDTLWVRESCWINTANQHVHYCTTDQAIAQKKTPSIHMPRWASRITLEITDVDVQRLCNISEEDCKAEGVEDLSFERFDNNRDYLVCPECGGTRLVNKCGMNLGILPDCDCSDCDTYKKRFRNLWNSIYEKRGLGWDKNPWLWVITFKRKGV